MCRTQCHLCFLGAVDGNASESERQKYRPLRRGGRFGNLPKGKRGDWAQCDAVSVHRLNRLAESEDWEPLPKYDGWGNTLDYCVDAGLLAGGEAESAYRFGVRSPGSDGEPTGTSYTVGAYDVSRTAEDVVWADGYFVTWPAAPKG